ncbi:hypothetical protein AC579_4558 [Lecanosticta acicola]|uniref:Uncharacterized protein n=1 Tax=Lecanosticta acicola TaxID=111012 RepID=A0AAI8YSQ2_9PEZI|nr:hypothetical protein AC579_4558 [Lecanosticta acicola]
MAMRIPDFRRENISLYTIPVFWAIIMYPRYYAATTYNKHTQKSLDGRKPREFAQTIQDSAQLDATTKGRLARAEAAVANGFENFGPFAAAVVAGSAAKLDPAFLNSVTIGFLVSRVVYNWVYITGESTWKAKMRGATYMSGMGMLFAIFISAGNRLKQAVL